MKLAGHPFPAPGRLRPEAEQFFRECFLFHRRSRGNFHAHFTSCVTGCRKLQQRGLSDTFVGQLPTRNSPRLDIEETGLRVDGGFALVNWGESALPLWHVICFSFSLEPGQT